MELKNIDFLIRSDGEITLGRVGPIRCAAIACDPHSSLAMLVRRRNESLMALLERLDAAIEDALEREVFVDEINP
jgi:hypothetical protein